MAGLGDLTHRSIRDDAEPTYRMSMLPFGTYSNSNGTESLGLALPAMIHEPLMAVERLFGTPSKPGTFTQGPDAPGNADDMRTLLLSLYGGNATGRIAREATALPSLRDTAQSLYRDYKYGTEPSPIVKGGAITGAHYADNVSTHPAFESPPMADILSKGAANDTLFGTLYDNPPVEGAYGNALINQARQNFRPNLSMIDGGLLSDTGKPSLMGSAIAGAEKPQGFDVWHGSPHDFDRFDISKIGTGEGAQAYGHGLYFAESPKVAKDYRDTLSAKYDTPQARAILQRFGGDTQKAAEFLRNQAPSGSPLADYYENLAQMTEAGGPAGYLYQARINANPEDFVSLDGRLGEQSPIARNALTSIIAERQPQLQIYPEFPVDGLMNVARLKPDEIAGALRNQGVPGLSYLDAGSRAAKEGSRNYVLFSDDPVDILHKWRGDTQLYSDGLPSLFNPALYQDNSPQGSYASGGNVTDTSGLSGLRMLPDYGFGPMTPTTIAGRPNDYLDVGPAQRTWLDTAADVGSFPAKAVVGQFDAAGTGIADALNDPSLPNLTNAGVQTGLAMMSPELTLGSAALGYGTAGLRDLAGSLIPDADAKRLNKAPRTTVVSARPSAPPVDPLIEKYKDDPTISLLLQQIAAARVDATRDYPGRNGDASRASAATQVQTLQEKLATELARRDQAKRDAAQKIYDQQVQEAIAARDLARARDRRFTDTEVGKVYDKVGVGPLLAGLVPGVVTGLAKGPAETGLGRLGLGLEGAGFGIGAAFAPDVFNMTQAPASNPEKEAMEAYAYNLPDDHPDKIKAKEYADSLPALNPVQTAAKENLTDPWLLGERILGGGAEGIGGALVGQYLPRAWGGFWKPGTYDWSFQDGLGALFRPRAAAPTIAESPVPSAAASKLRAGNLAAAEESSGPVGPASGNTLPARPEPSDIEPAVPVKKVAGVGRRSKSAGSKGSSKAGTVSSDNPPALPDSQSAASDELKRFLGAKQAPDLRDLKKNFSTGGRVSIDEAAKSVSATPTLGQKEAGNYKKAHVRLHGMDIAIENPRGSERFGVDKGGKRWSVNMPDHYGYIKRTEGKDGDHVDCYIGPNENSKRVYVVDQNDINTGRFDEHKVMLGYANKDAALDSYRRAFSDGKGSERVGSVKSLSVDDFKNWLNNGNTKRPIERQKFATGGAVHSDKTFSGPLHSTVAGRTDHLPIDVTAGSYVIPADVVSALGEGNTNAGTQIIDHMFPKQPASLHYASGGKVPIMAAGGEVVLSPEQVAVVGGGDLNHGHSILDAWVKTTRNDTINTLKSLPGPQK